MSMFSPLKIFIYLFLSELGLHCYAWAFSSCGEWWLLFVVVCRLLIVVTSLVKHPSMGFSRQEYWSGLPCPPAGNLPDPGIEPASLTSPSLARRFFSTSMTWEAQIS